ncbi:MAG: hypothetical protein EVA89_33465 [Sandaracinaceae bacterium]|nr:MAG: hypothetical protein EVA89_33465 [Sandaracinaceae bacterium]
MRRLFPFLAALLLLPACRPTKLAGESVGQFRVDGELLETTCGDGHPVLPTLLFHVELRDEPGTIGYWKLSDGPIASGSYEAGAFRFEDATQHVGVDATDGHPGCVVERREVIEGALVQGVTHDGAVGGADAGVPHDGGGDGEPRDGFDGTTTVRITPTAGSECSLLLQPQGGAFPALPCGFSYRLRGTRLEEPLW